MCPSTGNRWFISVRSGKRCKSVLSRPEWQKWQCIGCKIKRKTNYRTKDNKQIQFSIILFHLLLQFSLDSLPVHSTYQKDSYRNIQLLPKIKTFCIYKVAKELDFVNLPCISFSISTSVCILQNCDINNVDFQSKLYNFKHCFFQL